MTKPLIVIPARMNSSRFWGKPLSMIYTRPMIEHVWYGVSRSGYDAIVATDSREVKESVEGFGGKAIITGDANTGTDRVAMAARDYDPDETYSIIINVQGDIPFVEPSHIKLSLEPLEAGYGVGTVVSWLSPSEQNISSIAKAVVSWDGDVGRVHWFLRAPLNYGYHHIGIYAFRREVLNKYHRLPQSEHEKKENLEQLRAIENHIRIGAAFTKDKVVEINTPSDREPYALKK